MYSINNDNYKDNKTYTHTINLANKFNVCTFYITNDHDFQLGKEMKSQITNGISK